MAGRALEASEIREMPAGREMDELVALAIGWTFRTFPDGVLPSVKHWSRPGAPDKATMLPGFSRRIEAAWEVFDSLPEGSWINKPWKARTHWEVGTCRGEATPWFTAVAPTASLAICRAALLAKLAEGEDE